MKSANARLLTIVLCLVTCAPACILAQEYEDIHNTLYEDVEYPSAQICKSCHIQHYKEWSVSPHAYAQVSPVFNAMFAKLNMLANGTMGDFCIRCHTPVGMTQNEELFIPNEQRSQAAFEGVTCIVCHRREKAYGVQSGRFSPTKGNILAPVVGPTGNKELRRVIESGEYDVITEPGIEGRLIHRDVKKFYQLPTSGFCGSCHDVNFINGFRLEEAFSEYKNSPASRKGISCQDCHMGKTPGVVSGYNEGPAAVVGGVPTRTRKVTNHMFIGPDYSIVHPGIYPHNPEAQNVASMRDWIKFKFTEGWGTDTFEDNVDDEYAFPQRWADASDRYEAREVINENLELLEFASSERLKLLKIGYLLGDVKIKKASEKGIKFYVQVKNGTDGHNVPTGFDAERVVFLRVTVTDANGHIVFESGDLDPNGDLRDLHSIYVHNGEAPIDKYLFNLQSKFVVNMAFGPEREQILDVNYSPDPIPFARRPGMPFQLFGRPPSGGRKHRATIVPNGSEWPKYVVTKKELLGSTPPYRANVKLITGMVPVNLVYAIQEAGFDYNMSPRDVADAVVAGHQVVWEKDFELHKGIILDEDLPAY